MDVRANILALCLIDALEDENEKMLNNIMDKYSVDPSYVQPERGIAPLHYACGMSNHEVGERVARRFIQHASDVNVRSNENMTPLHVAAMYGRIEIVKMLLENDADLDVHDIDRKTPVMYAVEECNFEVVLLMRDHIFLNKYKQKQRERLQQQEQLLIQNPLPDPQKENQVQVISTPNNEGDFVPACGNKNLLGVSNDSNDKYTPKRTHYNYDVTSPYYINITHRRNKPQPILPVQHSIEVNEDKSQIVKETAAQENVDENSAESINLFALTKDNMNQLSKTLTAAERSRLSLIESWREKVHRTRTRDSIKQFDDIKEMIDTLVQNENLNFTNTKLRSSSKINLDAAEVDSGACGSESDSMPNENTEYLEIQQKSRLNISLGTLIQKVAQAKVVDSDPVSENDISFRTVPEMPRNGENCLQVPLGDEISFSVPAARSDEYFLQMTEAYVHADNENGLVFYETKMLSNNRVAQEELKCASNLKSTKEELQDPNTTATSKSTELTLPADYETDELRAELKKYGEVPGPITKSTKRLYIKRLIKFKRVPYARLEMLTEFNANKIKFSVELHRTLRSHESYQRIQEYMEYESLLSSFFANNTDKRQMREGHLKHSFIYMLLDPRISCNLPGETVLMDKLIVWKRFLDSIFYVGKGKTSRPYSHLYDAMKTHSRMQIQQQQEQNKENNQQNPFDRKVSIKKYPINVELFKSPPKRSSDNKKIDRILNIWANENGVVCLHVFHNICPTDAYTREAAIIDALSLRHLTNLKRGDYYGPAQNWTMKEKKYLGIALLYKAMQIYLAEGESQLSPSDLIK